MKTQDITFPQADAYPKWLVPAALACGIPLFLWFAIQADNPLRGFVACLSAGSVVVVFVTLRQWRTRLSFWLAIGLNALVHTWLVTAISGTDSHFPGMIFAPVVIADFLLWQRITVALLRRLRV